MTDSAELKRDEASLDEYKKTLDVMVVALVQAAPVLSRHGPKDDEARAAYRAVFTALHRLGLTKVSPHDTHRESSKGDPRSA